MRSSRADSKLSGEHSGKYSPAPRDRPGTTRQPFFTIGHSTRTVAELIHLLQQPQIELLVDVRTMPRSRTNPQFNADSLPQALAAAGIGYEHLAALGGLRGRRRDAAPSVNVFWENASFRNYADYTASDTFRQGLQHLRELGGERRCAVMCAEAVWWRCHRRIIADYLIADGETVYHLLGAGRAEPAKLTPAAQGTPDGTLIYPRSPPSRQS
jgi:uncharacterized protein (DUF488 family)